MIYLLIPVRIRMLFASSYSNPGPPIRARICEYLRSPWIDSEELFPLSCVGEHILQEFNTLYLTRFRTYKIARPPQTKNLGGEGASDR